MKKHFLNHISVKFFAGSLTAAMLFLTTQSSVSAQKINNSVTQTTSVTASDKVQVKYLGTVNEDVYFGVKYNNANAATFSITVLDEIGDVLYQGNFSDKLFDKKFKLPKDYSKVSFVVKSTEDKFEQSFLVNINSRVVEDVIVSRN